MSCHGKPTVPVLSDEETDGVHGEIKLGAGANDEGAQTLYFVVPLEMGPNNIGLMDKKKPHRVTT